MVSRDLHIIGTKAFLRSLRSPHGGPLPNLMLGIATLLWAQAPRPATPKELVAWIYEDCEDGGPEWAISGVRTAVHRLRKRGLPIKSLDRRGYYFDLVAA